MVKIYTRKGDDGSTGLWYGGRVPKSGCAARRPTAPSTRPPRRWALPAWLAAQVHEELAADILRIQNELFIAGAELATAPEAVGRLEAGRDSRSPRT